MLSSPHRALSENSPIFPLLINLLIWGEQLITSLGICSAMMGLVFSRCSWLPQKWTHTSSLSDVLTQIFQLLASSCIPPGVKESENLTSNPATAISSWGDLGQFLLSLGFHIHMCFHFRFPGLWNNQTILCVLKCVANYKNTTQMLVFLWSKWLLTFYKSFSLL